MATPTTTHSRRSSSSDLDWDVVDWSNDNPVKKAVPDALSKLLLEAEEVIAEGYGEGVVLLNTNEAGTLLVTNFRLLFLGEGFRNIIPLGTIPLATIEKFNKIANKLPLGSQQLKKTPSPRLLQIIGKDMRIIVFGFQPHTKQRRGVFDVLKNWTRPASLGDLYAFASGPCRFSNKSPKVRLRNEYLRLLGLRSNLWRISVVNANYTVCPTYPSALLIPKSFSDEDVHQACTFRARHRLPVISWFDQRTGAVLARSSQPLVGLRVNTRSNADEKLVAAFCTHMQGASEQRRKLYIADARSRTNAFANMAKGGGSESSSSYFHSEIVFFGIYNIHGMRKSIYRLRDYLDTHGTTSSDGTSSFLRHGGPTWGGGNLSSVCASVSSLSDTGWLTHVPTILAASAWIAARVALESASVLVHCSDGWDRTTQLVSLAGLLLDPYYRTFKGFQALIEKDWLAFGHPFADRAGMPSASGSIPSPPSQSPASHENHSPIFLQAFLVDLLDCMFSCRFGNFLCNSEKEREQCNISEACGCVWTYLADLRVSDGNSHVHYNLFYEPLKHEGPLLLPATALAPTLWPEFHLRWACPSEAQTREVGARRSMAKKFS